MTTALTDANSKRRLFAAGVKAGTESIDNFPAIKGWRSDLFPYQKRGVVWMMAMRKCILADGVGLGKTPQALALVALWKQLKQPHRTLIFCNNSQNQRQWVEQVQKFSSDLRYVIIDGPPQARKRLYQAKNWDVMLVRYSLMQLKDSQDHKWITELCDYQNVICDEAAAPGAIRSHNTNTARRVKQLTRKAQNVILLDATPVQTSILDIHSLTESFHAGIFENRRSFDQRYLRREKSIFGNGRNGKILGVKKWKEFTETVSPFILQRHHHSVEADLPDVISSKIYLEPTPRQKRLYREARQGVVDVLTQAGERLSDHQLRVKAESQFHHLQYLANSTVITDPLAEAESNKVDWIVQHIAGQTDTAVQGAELLQSGIGPTEKVIIFTRYKNIIPLLQRRLNQARIGNAVFSGDTSKDDRVKIIDAFWNDPALRVLISTQTLERGLNLQKSGHLICLDSMYNPQRMEQLLGRIRRLGSEYKSVNFIRLLTMNTIEEKMDTVLNSRNAVADALLEKSSDIFDRLSTAELLALLQED